MLSTLKCGGFCPSGFPKPAVGLGRLNLDVFGVKATHVMVSHFHQKLSVSALKYWIFFSFFLHLPL